MSKVEQLIGSSLLPLASLLTVVLCNSDIAIAKNAVSSGKNFKDCPDCSEMVVMPGGVFDMGVRDSELSEHDIKWGYDLPRPSHSVTIPSFALGKTPVTRSQFAAFVKATGYHTDDACWTYEGKAIEGNGPSVLIDAIVDGGGATKRTNRNWQSPGVPQTNGDPVVCVSWNDAKAYVKWLSEKTGKHYRLPSEAEWEYASRAGTKTARYWGDAENGHCMYENALDPTAARELSKIDVEETACSDGFAYTSPVGSFKPNAFGLYDMLGNVYQWTEDCFNRNYVGAPADGGAWATGDCSKRVLRGGSWHTLPKYLRVNRRAGSNEGNRDNTVGFRIARDLP